MFQGQKLSVYDVSKDAMSAIVEKGGKSYDSPADVASSGADCIVTMLPNNKIVLDVYFGDNGILSKVKN